MLNQNNQLNIIRKWFEFPLSIKSFSIDENAKTATYEYAWMNWALHERVLNYRTMNMSWTFATESWVYADNLTPEQYIKKLFSLNDNKPWLLVHPLLWTFMCIIHSLKVKQAWDEVEWDSNNDPIPNFSFDIEFREFGFSGWNKDLDKLYPAIAVRPVSDYYTKKLKYPTCDLLYQALVDWYIVAWNDPIINAEWLLYDTWIRACALWKYTAAPIWTNNKITLKNTKKKTYKIKPWESLADICKKYNTTLEQVAEENKWQVVRDTPPTPDGKKTNIFTGALNIKVWDNIAIPSPNMTPIKLYTPY